MVSFSVHVLHAYVATGLITEQYNFNFAILDISLLWNIFLFAKKASFPRAISFFYLFLNCIICIDSWAKIFEWFNLFKYFIFNIYGFWLVLSPGAFQVFCFVYIYY